MESADVKNESLEEDTLIDESNVLENDLHAMNQYDISPVDMPMEQDLEHYQVADEDEDNESNQVEDNTVDGEFEEGDMQEETGTEIIVSEAEESPKIMQNAARTIAPKPVAPKIMGTSSGQQILFIQNPNAQSGQTIRLISGAGAPTAGSYQLVKRPDGVMQLRQTPAKIITTSPTKKIAPAPAAKNVFTKVIVKGSNQHMVIGTPTSESIKILPMANTSGSVKVTSPTKTITLAQAHNMGLIRGNNAKMQVVSTLSKVGIKTPMKILPAPAHGITPIKSTRNQNVVLKQGALKPMTNQMVVQAKASPTTLIKTNIQVPGTKANTSGSSTTQVIKIQTGQNSSNGQIHQINVPGRGVQYVRLISNTSSGGTQIAKNTTFTTRAVLKTASQVKSAIVSIRPALSGAKTLVTTKPAVTKPAMKLQSTIMTTKAVGSSISSSLASTSSSLSKAIQAVYPKGSKVQSNRIVISGKNSSGMAISPSQLSQIPGATLIPTGNSMQQLVVIPAQYMQQLKQKNNVSQEEPNFDSVMDMEIDDPLEERSLHGHGRSSKLNKLEIKRELSLENLTLIDKRGKDIVEANGIRPRKPCNCTRSQCLKLYCDCFANGEFCNMCNCKDCMNNIENEEERQRAIRSCLDRNPSAFRPKIGKAKDPGLEAIRRHNKGCNCKRSGCLKNYCECFEAKIACSNNCKCIGCRNIEDCLERKRGWADDLDGLSNKKFASGEEDDLGWPLGREMIGNNKWPINFITSEVIEATCQCLLAQADEAIKNNTPENEENDIKIIDEIYEEFGRCLVQIIECFHKTSEGPSDESS